MSFPKSPRVFLSGAGGGLGRAMALELAKEGARLLLTDVKLAAAEETAQLVTKAGGTAITQKCDVTKIEDVEAASDALIKHWGGTDIVLNNAGVSVAGKVGEVPLADWDWILRINLYGVVHGCHVFVPQLRRSGHGFVLNVASSAGFASLPEMGAYNVAKAGVISLSETLAVELRGSGVRVSALCPTFFRSGIVDQLRTPDATQRDIANEIMARTKVTSETIAKVALKGLERGKLYVVPQFDGGMVWRMKRFFPSLYPSVVSVGHRLMTKQLAAGAQARRIREPS